MDQRNVYQLYHNDSLVVEEDLSLLDSALVESITMRNEDIIEKEKCELPTMEVKVEKFCVLLSELLDKKVIEVSMHSGVEQVSKYQLRPRKTKRLANDDVHSRSLVENADEIDFLRPTSNEEKLEFNGIDNSENTQFLSGKGEAIEHLNIDGSAPAKVIPFCDTCNKFFISEENLNEHKKSQNHAKKILNVFPCDIGNRTFVTRDPYRQHMRKQERRDKFPCTDCNKPFMYEVDLRKHELFVHDKKSLVCYICSKVLLTSDSLERHEERCDSKIYPCGVCGKQFRKWNQLSSHKMTHLNNRPYTCDICGHKSKTENCLRLHQRTHDPEKMFPCAQCEEKFATLNQLRMHSCVAEGKTTTTGVQPFMCVLCEQGFVQKLMLVEHMQIHGMKKSSSLEKGITNPTCDLCGLKLSGKWRLKRHKKSVHGIKRPFKCGLCDDKFKTRSDLSQHKKEAHAKMHLYMCGVCKKTFVHLQALERHQAIHSNNRPFKCTLCDKSFRRKDHLKSHELQHGGEKRFECQQCQKKFFTNSHLRMHMKTHNDVKPFACRTCDKGFISKSDLEAHSHTHTGAKQYKCSLCGQGFAKNRTLQKHMLQH